MDKDKIISALDKYDYKYITQNEVIIVKLAYAQQIIIELKNDDKVIIKDKLVAWNFLTGSIQMNMKKAMLYNFIGLVLFGFLLISRDDNFQNFTPLFLVYITFRQQTCVATFRQSFLR